MARVLNNEVSILNIASLDNDIKDSFTRAMVSENENTTSVASKAYSEGEYFIHNDRYLYKALTDISIGETITPDVNAEVVTVSEELVKLYSQSPEGIFEVLSNVETTSTASKNYVKGEQIIWTDKELYTVTTDVTIGTTWTVGTNLAAASNLTTQMKTFADNDDAMLNVLGAKNLLPNNAITKVENGVTFTVNSNGSVTVSTVSGGATAATQCDIGDSPVGMYHLSGCPSGGSVDTYSLYVSGQYLYETGDGLDINFTASRRVMIMIKSGTIITTPITFYPMIRPSGVQDSTYVPYAMTNRELTTVETIIDTNGIEVKRYGRIIEIIGHGNSHVNQDVILPSNSPYRPLANVIAAGFTASELARVGIRPNGTLIFTTANGTPITTATNCYFQLSYTI